MKFYGSLTNRLEENHNYLGRDIQEGDYATIYLWSDSHAYEVVKVDNQKHLFIRRLKAIRTDNNGAYTECQEYKYEPDENNPIKELKLGKKFWNTIYRDTEGKVYHKERTNISFGVANEYFDYSF